MTLRRISGINTGFRTQAWQIPTMVSNFINPQTKYNNIVSMIRIIKALLNFKNRSQLKPDLNFCSPGRFHVDLARDWDIRGTGTLLSSVNPVPEVFGRRDYSVQLLLPNIIPMIREISLNRQAGCTIIIKDKPSVRLKQFSSLQYFKGIKISW